MKPRDLQSSEESGVHQKVRCIGEVAEDALVTLLTSKLHRADHIVVGPGDDCAVVRLKGAANDDLLLKTDCLVEGVHFLRNQPSRSVGWKALCRALSDIGAMGGIPDAAVVTLALPRDLEVRYVEALYEGLEDAARRFGVSIVGGESSKSLGGIFISVAVTGWVPRDQAVLRSGGAEGDWLLVTGQLGGSGDGRHLEFVPRVREARWLIEHFCLHAMMDLSDGLGSDLPRLAAASGLGYQLDLAKIPRMPGCSVEQALQDGEDYELLIAVAPEEAQKILPAWEQQFRELPFTRIGQLVAREAGQQQVLPAGWQHFGASEV